MAKTETITEIIQFLVDNNLPYTPAAIALVGIDRVISGVEQLGMADYFFLQFDTDYDLAYSGWR